ncbi:unnamed protein product, partial [Rotaria magnacalcarata]
MGKNEDATGYGNRLKSLYMMCFPKIDYNDNVELKNKFMGTIPTNVKVELQQLIKDKE